MPTTRVQSVREITGVRLGHYGSTYPGEDSTPGEDDRARERFVQALLVDLKTYCDVFQLDMSLADGYAEARFQDRKAGLT